MLFLTIRLDIFIFGVVDNEFYLFLMFGEFNVTVHDVGYYLLVYFIVFMHLIPVA